MYLQGMISTYVYRLPSNCIKGAADWSCLRSCVYAILYTTRLLVYMCVKSKWTLVYVSRVFPWVREQLITTHNDTNLYNTVYAIIDFNNIHTKIFNLAFPKQFFLFFTSLSNVKNATRMHSFIQYTAKC